MWSFIELFVTTLYEGLMILPKAMLTMQIPPLAPQESKGKNRSTCDPHYANWFYGVSEEICPMLLIASKSNGPSPSYRSSKHNFNSIVQMRFLISQNLPGNDHVQYFKMDYLQHFLRNCPEISGYKHKDKNSFWSEFWFRLINNWLDYEIFKFQKYHYIILFGTVILGWLWLKFACAIDYHIIGADLWSVITLAWLGAFFDIVKSSC